MDHISLSILIIIEEEHIQEKKQTIVKNSEEEKNFINELRNKLSSIDISYIFNSDVLEQITQEFATIVKDLWNKYSKLVNITK